MITNKSALQWSKLDSWTQKKEGHFIQFTKQGVPCKIYLNTFANTLVIKGKIPIQLFTDEYLISWQHSKSITYRKRWTIREELRDRGYFIDTSLGRKSHYAISCLIV